MKAVTITGYGGLERLVTLDVPRPAPGPTDVVVTIRAAALNHLDLFVIGGLPGITHTFPHIMGSDGAGVIESVGAAVTGLKPGDRVLLNPGVWCGHCDFCRQGEHSLCDSYGLLGEHRSGTLAEALCVPAVNCVRLEGEVAWPEAAAFPLTFLTAWRMLTTKARLRKGETVLIWGIGGGVALAALAIAKHLGARVIVTSSSEEKLARARALGADELLNHQSQDVAKEVRQLTSRRGADVVVDSVGQATWEASQRALARAGRLVTCGGTSGPMLATDVRRLFWHQWTILGTTMGSRAEFDAVAALFAAAKLRPVVDQVVPLERANEAFERLQKGAQFGKIVVQISQ